MNELHVRKLLAVNSDRGVETPEQAASLLELGCEFAQGFYYSKAVESAVAGLLIGSQPWQALDRRTA